MRLDTYQRNAQQTDQNRETGREALLLPLLGLVGETGSLITAYKKRLRDGDTYKDFKEVVSDDIGDILWYVANISHIFKLRLSEVVIANIEKIEGGVALNKYKDLRRSNKAKVLSVLDHAKKNPPVTFSEYQKFVGQTKIYSESSELRIVAFLGVLGNTARLLNEFKNYETNERTHAKYKKIVALGLGDVLWFLFDIANQQKLNLADCAENNLRKTHEIWPPKTPKPTKLPDLRAPEDERFPRKFSVTFKDRNKRVLLQVSGVNIGDQLTDNSHRDDGYRFHDAYHLAYVAVLGWSPVIRALLKRKRKYKPAIDHNEDGARAALLEEAITGLIYDDALKRGFYLDGGNVSIDLLKHIKDLTQNLEVSDAKSWEWIQAIKQGSKVFSDLKKNKGGIVRVDMINRKLSYSARRA